MKATKKNTFRIGLGLLGIVVLIACGGQNTQNTSDGDAGKQPETKVVNEHKGKQLIAQSDCMACHKDRTKLIGPSYAQIALRYPETPENIKYLAESIIKGGVGVWGNISMTAHPQMSMEDAEEMVRYMYTLK